jgi:hypothetical protein
MAYTLVPTELIVDGAITSAKLDTNIAISGTLGVTGEVTLATHLVMGDNDKIKIGTGGDLEIYHDGSNSYISNSTGNIYLGDTNGSVHIQAKLNEESIVAAADGAVSLYHDNAVKLATSSAGVTVTGALTSGAITSSGLITATSLDISGDIDIDGTTNLDVVDIDGAVDMASTLTMSAGGTISAGGANDLVLNAGASGTPDIYLQSGGGTKVKIEGSDNTVTIGLNNSSSSNLTLYGATSAESQIFFGNDGTNGNKDGAIRYFHEAHGTTANRRSMTFSTANTERMRINATGVGIGTDSPLSKMTIAQTSGNTALTFQQTNNGTTNFLIGCQYNVGNAFEITPSTAAGGSTFNSPALVVNSSGNIGINETSPAKLGLTGGSGKVLHLGGDDCQVRLANSILHHDNSGNTILHLRNNYGATSSAAQTKIESGFTTFHTGTSFTERMRIQSTGRTAFFQTVGGGAVTIRGEGGTSFIAISFTHNNDNGVGYIQTGASSVTYSTSSDYRLKENVVPMENGLERIQKLKPVKFNWKLDGEESEGFLAHEVQEAGWDDGLTGSKDDNLIEDGQQTYQGMDYGRITPLLVKAIQEQQAQIEIQNTLITNLTARIETLEG